MDNDVPHVSRNDAVAVAILALVALTSIAMNVYLALQGHFVRRASYSDVAIAIGGFAMLRFAAFGRAIRIAAALWALGATTKALSHYLHTSPQIERLAAIDGQALKLIGSVVMIVGAILWFRQLRIEPSGSPENTLGLR